MTRRRRLTFVPLASAGAKDETPIERMLGWLGAGHIVRGTEPPLLVNVHQIDVISTVDVQPGIGSVRKIGHGTWSPGIGFRRPRSAATCSLQVVNRGTRHPMQLLAETSTVQIVLTKRGPPPFVEDKVGDGRRRLFATTS